MARREVTQRYRDKHRDELRAKGRAYWQRKAEENGTAKRGSPEWLAKRGPDHYPKGEKHGNWKGEAASYSAHHHWINRWGTRTGLCAKCGNTPAPSSTFRKVGTEWANVSGEYRRDLSDYVELCAPCHRQSHARGLIHGTATGYGYYGCRCALCRQANTQRKRDDARRKKASH